MVFVVGVVLFALGLLLSIAWHECGHMWAAQRTGMYVRRYFIGFGPTLWSTRRGDTEYGVKALPLGGFCDIAGMTTYDEIVPEQRHRAMYLQHPWKRLVVLFAGPLQNFILGFVLIVILALGWGLPNLNPPPTPARVAALDCVGSSMSADGTMSACSGTGPAGAAGLRVGDEIVAADGKAVSKAADLSPIIQQSQGPVSLTVRRGEQTLELTVNPATVNTPPAANQDQNGSAAAPTSKRMIGIAFPGQELQHYNVLTAIPGAAVFTGQLMEKTWDSLISMPSKIADLWTAVTGGQRSDDTPVSVYGASVIGGEAADHGSWSFFIFLLASINFFLGVFNLIPLLPLDGGHMALVGYEKVRDLVRRRLGKPAGGPVDYMRLMPATYAVIAVMGCYMVLTLAADIINPIKVF
ncbi:M50 family metallopeptidase [Gordonia jinhuaensis]|uniref:Zinc metalloprotease Rip1 n=1 Tax=Gordonia jinhuaensis TaxID=1517702 RepID=A0A916WSY8_9ACTN|nr:M50 family metallopeptidase [Gordonia jinhuaensis]GGB26940.1 zinc metalloprotease Rip1 [Gordonia jinhuaensis]